MLALPGKGEKKVLEGRMPYRILSSSPAPRQEAMEVVFLFEDFEEQPKKDTENDSHEPGR